MKRVYIFPSQRFIKVDYLKSRGCFCNMYNQWIGAGRTNLGLCADWILSANITNICRISVPSFQTKL